MRLRKIIFTLIFLTSILGQVLACSCIDQRTVQEEIKHADAVVVGTIISKQMITLTDSTILKMFPNDTTMANSSMSKMTIASYIFLVQDIYKGKITNDTIIIYTGLGGGDCGIRFEVNKQYIVYGEDETYFGQINNDFKFPKSKNSFWTYSCLRTTFYNQDELNEIEKFANKQTLKSNKVDAPIFADPDFPPVYKNGGDIGLKKFIRENLLYPKDGQCVTGRVFVSFIVDTLGMVKDIEIKKGLTPATENEAVRVVKMLTFIPGTLHGCPIETKMVLSIKFEIE